MKSKYYIKLSPNKQIEVYCDPFSSKGWSIAAYLDGTENFLKHASAFNKFKEFVSNAANSLEVPMNDGPTSIRLSVNEPATNKISIVALASSATVEAIFDPYFEDSSLKNLLVFNNLGLRLASRLKILTTNKKLKSLSSTFRNDFQRQLGIILEVRTCASKSEHRRFLLLSGSQSLIIGCSLNHLDKNEAAHVESSKQDKLFFDAEWTCAKPI